MVRRLDLAVIIKADAWREAVPAAEALCRRAADAAFAAAAPSALLDVAASVVLSDDERLRDLNRSYRGIDKSTNVLSFQAMTVEQALAACAAPPPAEAGVEAEAGREAEVGPEPVLGDVVIALETAVAEAAAEGKTVADHLSHLVVHGILHLLGHDHEAVAEAEQMEALEVAVLAAVGVADPYAATCADPK